MDDEGSSIGLKKLNLYYYGFRYYNPELGSWTSRDPLERSRLGVTPYNFVLNNPVSNIDIWGLKEYVDGDQLNIKWGSDFFHVYIYY